MFSLPQFRGYSPHPHQAGLQPRGTLTPAEHFPQHCLGSGTHRSLACEGKARLILEMKSLEAETGRQWSPDWKKALRGGSEGL